MLNSRLLIILVTLVALSACGGSSSSSSSRNPGSGEVSQPADSDGDGVVDSSDIFTAS